MFIHEAVKAAFENRKDGGYITRRAWSVTYITREKIHGAPAKLMLTLTPDKLVYISAAEPNGRPGWQPTVADLLADDWGQTW